MRKLLFVTSIFICSCGGSSITPKQIEESISDALPPGWTVKQAHVESVNGQPPEMVASTFTAVVTPSEDRYQMANFDGTRLGMRLHPQLYLSSPLFPSELADEVMPTPPEIIARIARAGRPIEVSGQLEIRFGKDGASTQALKFDPPFEEILENSDERSAFPEDVEIVEGLDWEEEYAAGIIESVMDRVEAREAEISAIRAEWAKKEIPPNIPGIDGGLNDSLVYSFLKEDHPAELRERFLDVKFQSSRENRNASNEFELRDARKAFLERLEKESNEASRSQLWSQTYSIFDVENEYDFERQGFPILISKKVLRATNRDVGLAPDVDIHEFFPVPEATAREWSSNRDWNSRKIQVIFAATELAILPNHDPKARILVVPIEVRLINANGDVLASAKLGEKS